MLIGLGLSCTEFASLPRWWTDVLGFTEVESYNCLKGMFPARPS